MGKTSSEVKRRYNSKTYKRWGADLRFEDFDKLEASREEFSRAEFLKILLKNYKNGQEVERMGQNMTQAELIIFLETLAENVELKAATGEDAAKIIRDKIEQLK